MEGPLEIEIPEDKYRILSNRELLKLGENLGRWIATDSNSPLLEDEDSSASQSALNLKKDLLLSKTEVNSTLDKEDSIEITIINPSSKPSENSAVPIKILPRKTNPKEIPILSKLNPKFPIRTNILKHVNHKHKKITSSKTDLNMNSISVTYKQRQKDQILRDRKVITVEMIYTRHGVVVYLRDVNGEQIFLTQHIKVTSGTSAPPSRYQTVKSVTFIPICDKTKLAIPQIITNIAAKIHLCPVKDCTEAFLQPALAKTHTLKHLGVKPYKCTHPGCKWEFFKETHLTRHISTHEGKKGWVCDIPGCNKDFSNIYNLNDHKKKIHVYPATIPCPVEGCKETFRHEKELKKHCKEHSESEAPFQCNFEDCTKSFFTEPALETHSKCHNITNRHVCNFPDCGRICNSAYRLKEHIRSHTGARPYGCDFPGCKWRFTTASKLKRHLKTHRDDKSYVCNVPGCNRSYRRNEHLRSHVQTHVQMAEMSETTKCQFCGVLHVSKAAHMRKFHPDIKDIVDVQKLLGITSGSNSPLTLTFSSEETFVSNNEVVNVKIKPTGEKTDEELLEEAIKSLGVPEMVLNHEELLKEPLDLLPAEDFSTVNLKDLD